MRRAIVIAAITATAAIAATACRSRTEIVVGLATDLHATDQLMTVQLAVNVDGTPLGGVGSPDGGWALTGTGATGLNLPASYGIVGEGDQQTVELVLTGFDGSNNPVVTRDAIISFVDGETLFYRMGLTASCETLQCAADQDCVEGTCKDKTLNAHVFPSFDDSLVDTLTCNSGTVYIDTSTGSAMGTSADVNACPPSLCQEGTCLIPPDNSISLGAAPAAIAKTECQKQFDCCMGSDLVSQEGGNYTDEAGCEQFETGEIQGIVQEFIQPAIDQGKLVYRGDILGACLGEISSASCEVAFGDNVDSQCNATLQGKVADGGACDQNLGNNECISGICESGVCIEPVALGGACPNFEPCVPGSQCFCDINASCTCMPFATAGQSCQTASCGGGSFCDATNDICTPFQPNGAACTEDFECQSDMCTSNDGTTAGTCLPLACTESAQGSSDAP